MAVRRVTSVAGWTCDWALLRSRENPLTFIVSLNPSSRDRVDPHIASGSRASPASENSSFGVETPSC